MMDLEFDTISTLENSGSGTEMENVTGSTDSSAVVEETTESAIEALMAVTYDYLAVFFGIYNSSATDYYDGEGFIKVIRHKESYFDDI